MEYGDSVGLPGFVVFDTANSLVGVALSKAAVAKVAGALRALCIFFAGADDRAVSGMWRGLAEVNCGLNVIVACLRLWLGLGFRIDSPTAEAMGHLTIGEG
jgi:hypothetical protein